jgi:hypothetical protein
MTNDNGEEWRQTTTRDKHNERTNKEGKVIAKRKDSQTVL